MSQSFRNEIFTLCKELQKNENIKEISNTIKSLKFTKRDIATGEIPKNLHGDFAQLADQNNSQFHGYLFVDDNADKIQKSAFISIKHLSAEERCEIEKGHKTLTRFIDLCLSDIRNKSSIIGDAISPYYLYRSVVVSDDSSSLLDDGAYDLAVNAFKNGRLYKALYSADLDNLARILNTENLQLVISEIEKEFNAAYVDEIPPNLNAFAMRLLNKELNAPDILYAYAIVIYALKESLRMACQLLYDAICGGNLVVLNNDNLIKIENRVSSQICEHYKAFVQGIIFSIVGNLIGDILLIDCDISTDEHIHKFGMVTSTTLQFSREFGETSKISFVVVDDEMIPIFNITNTILRHGLSPIVISK